MLSKKMRNALLWQIAASALTPLWETEYAGRSGGMDWEIFAFVGKATIGVTCKEGKLSLEVIGVPGFSHLKDVLPREVYSQSVLAHRLVWNLTNKVDEYLSGEEGEVAQRLIESFNQIFLEGKSEG